MDDTYDLARFVEAQDSAGAYDSALAELRAGRKSSHWMWFVFPQLAGLGHSPMSRRYGISSLGEAEAFLRHPVLGGRLRECARALLQLHQVSAEEVLGSLDAQKLRSSMTLFLRAAPEEALLAQVLERYFEGRPDETTEERI